MVAEDVLSLDSILMFVRPCLFVPAPSYAQFLTLAAQQASTAQASSAAPPVPQQGTQQAAVAGGSSSGGGGSDAFQFHVPDPCFAKLLQQVLLPSLTSSSPAPPASSSSVSSAVPSSAVSVQPLLSQSLLARLVSVSFALLDGSAACQGDDLEIQASAAEAEEEAEARHEAQEQHSCCRSAQFVDDNLTALYPATAPLLFFSLSLTITPTATSSSSSSPLSSSPLLAQSWLASLSTPSPCRRGVLSSSPSASPTAEAHVAEKKALVGEWQAGLEQAEAKWCDAAAEEHEEQHAAHAAEAAELRSLAAGQAEDGRKVCVQQLSWLRSSTSSSCPTPTAPGTPAASSPPPSAPSPAPSPLLVLSVLVQRVGRWQATWGVQCMAGCVF